MDKSLDKKYAKVGVKNVPKRLTQTPNASGGFSLSIMITICLTFRQGFAPLALEYNMLMLEEIFTESLMSQKCLPWQN